MNIQSMNRIIIVIACFLLWPNYVAAHAKLVSSAPAANESVETAPKSILLTFNKPVESAFSSIRVFDLDDNPVKSEKPAHQGNNAKTLEAILPPLSAGKYKVTWRIVATDGHKMKNEYFFSIK